MKNLTERFLRYAKIDTASDESTGTHPSTEKQLHFAQKLAEELKQIGLEEVQVSSFCYVTATLPPNTDAAIPVIGFIAHMDTSPEMSDENVNPRVIENYGGSDITLNPEKHIVMSTADFPSLLRCKGQSLIVTDGCTLLGADDKAGIAEIVTAMEFLMNHPEIKHGKLRICFTPDEEIGEGADNFDTDGFGADFAYTLDGDELGSLEYENFNAAAAHIVINGKSIHPGSAKNKMLNSMLIAMEFNSMLPPSETPSHTEGYEGFYHLESISGSVEKTTMYYIIRDHNMEAFLARKNRITAITSYLNEKYGSGTLELKLKDQYYNMKEKIMPVFEVVELARRAMLDCGITPVEKPIRGGTDGARLTYMGLPTPNLFTGGTNFHGRYEYVSIDTMIKAVEVITKIVQLAAEGK